MGTHRLIVGVGGTGTWMVRYMSQQWEAEFGGVPDGVKMMAIDARTRPEGEPLPPYVLYAPVPRGINYPLEFGLHQQRTESEINDWWPEGVLPAGNIRFNDGCGCNRPNGRFFVMHFASHVESVIRRALDELFTQRFSGVGAAPTVEIYLMASLGNGTGGGTFMDIATIAADLLKERVGEVQHIEISGVFIPGSVTRHGPNTSTLRRQISAAGLGALVELQYEFNRRNGGKAEGGLTAGGSGERRFRGWYDGRYEDRSTPMPAVQRGVEPVGQSPFAYAFILDRNNAGGWQSDFDRIKRVGADAVRALIGGADVESRLLDLERTVQTTVQCFGSLGYCRMRAPTREFGDFASAEIAIQALDICLDRQDMTPWSDLLSLGFLELPSRRRAEPGPNGRVGVKSSVEFFLGPVMAIREFDEARNCHRSHNDLFDRLEAHDSARVEQFRGLLNDLNNASGSADLVESADRLGTFVQRSTTTANAEYQQVMQRLLHGQGAPTAQELQEARGRGDDGVLRQQGVVALLSRVVREFMLNGAFGAACSWLDQFVETIDANKTSVYEGERIDRRADDPSIGEGGLRNLHDLATELRASANGLFSFLRRGAIVADVGTFASEASTLFTRLLDVQRVQAIMSFYDNVLVITRELRDTVDALVNRVESAELGRAWRAELGDVEAFLDRRPNTAEAEMIVGDSNMVRALVRRLYDDPEVGARACLRVAMGGASGESPVNLSLFGALATCNRTVASQLFPEIRHTNVDAPGAVVELGQHLFAETKRLTMSRVNREASLEKLIHLQAETVYRAYEPIFRIEREHGHGAADTMYSNVRETRRDFADTFGKDGVEELQTCIINNEPPAKILERVRELAIDQKIRKLIGASTAQWDVRHSKGGMTFLNYASRMQAGQQMSPFHAPAGAIGTALSQQDEHFQIRAQAVRNLPSNVVECVTAVYGATLNDLNLTSEIANYLEALTAGSELRAGFSPHVTREMERVGRDWLAARAEASQATRISGALVLALAAWAPEGLGEAFEFASIEARTVRWAKDITMLRDEGGAPLFGGQTFARSSVISSGGLAQTVALLDGRASASYVENQRGQLMGDVLRELTWRDLRALMRGDETRPEVPFIGRQKVQEALAAYAAELDEAARTSGENDRGAALSAQASQIRELIEQLESSKGERRPPMLDVP